MVNVSVTAEASNGDNLRIRVRKSSETDLKYIYFETQAEVASGAASVWISQVKDVIAT
jgi:hypothetical protein